MTTMKTEGRCLFCNQISKKSTIYTHLKKHLEQLQVPGQSPSCHIKVESGIYFLYLLLPNDCTFEELDIYLREIWVWCCDHHSGFYEMRTAKEAERRGSRYYDRFLEEIGGAEEEYDDNEEWDKSVSEIPFAISFIKLFEEGKIFQYIYDYGSSTILKITCLKKYSYPIPPTTGVLLLSRNEPLPIMCSICKVNPAMYECWIHFKENEGVYCEECSEKHSTECSEFDNGSRSNICNSPRSGVCVYSGGTIDTERDGIYKISK